MFLSIKLVNQFLINSNFVRFISYDEPKFKYLYQDLVLLYKWF